MPPHQISLALLAFALALLAPTGAPGEQEAKTAGPASAGLRVFEPVEDDRWLGNAVCYGPHRDGQRPGGPTPTAEQIREDVRIMAAHWGLLRLYGSTEFGRTVLEAIGRHQLEVIPDLVKPEACRVEEVRSEIR